MRRLIFVLIQIIFATIHTYGQFRDFPEKFDSKKNKIASVFIYETTGKNDTLNRILLKYNPRGQLIHREFDFYDVHSGSDYILVDYYYNQNNQIVKEILTNRTNDYKNVTTYEYKDSLLLCKKTNDGYYWLNKYNKENLKIFEGFYNDSNLLNQGTFFRIQKGVIYEKYLTEQKTWLFKNKYYTSDNQLKQELIYNEDSILICRTDYIYNNRKLFEEKYFEKDSLIQTTLYYYNTNDSLSCEMKLNEKNKINTFRILKYDKIGKLYEENFFCDRFDFRRQLYYNSKGDIDKQIYFSRNNKNCERRYIYTYWE